MPFCSNCGAQLAPGAVCQCQQNPQAQQNVQNPQNVNQQPYANQYQQPQQPYPYGQPYPPPNPYMMYPQMYPQMKIPRPGKTMIRVSGIIMTVLGGLALIVSFGLLGSLNGWYPDSWKAVIAYELFVTAVMLAFGITGIALAVKINKAMLIMSFGITLIALKVIDMILAFSILGRYMSGAYTSQFFVGIAGGIVLPILYIIGGNIRKKAQY